MGKPTPLHGASPPRPVGDRRPILRAMLNPKSIALIGATENDGRVGRTLMENLRSFSGHLFPVNPKRTSVLGIEAFPRIARCPDASGSSGNRDTRDRCPGRGQRMRRGRCKGCSHHFGGVQGIRRRWHTAGKSHPRASRWHASDWAELPGRNDSPASLNATFAKTMALPGNVAFISQSGALCTSILDWSCARK